MEEEGSTLIPKSGDGEHIAPGNNSKELAKGGKGAGERK